VKDKAESTAWLSIIIGVILFFFPLEYLFYAIFFIVIGVSIAVVKNMWVLAGWATDKIEELK
jgi:hypothetical protein